MKRYLLLLSILILGMELFATGAKEEMQTIIKVAGLKGPTGVGMIQMLETKPVFGNKASIEIELLGSSDLIVAKLLKNELDFAALPINTAAKLYSSGVDYVLGAIVGNGMLSLISSDKNCKSIQDLKGKTIYVSGQGAVPEYMFKWILEKEGLDPEKDVVLQFGMPYPEIAQSLIIGKIDYAILPEPFTSVAVSGNSSLSRVLDIQDMYTKKSGIASYPISAIVVRKSLLKTNPEIVRTFFAAYEKSITWVIANPKEAGLLGEKHEIGLKAKIIELSIPYSNFVFIKAVNAKLQIEKLLTLFLNYKPESIGSKLPDQGFYGSY